MAAPQSDIPTPEQIVPVLQNQSALMLQLESDNSFVKVMNHKLIDRSGRYYPFVMKTGANIFFLIGNKYTSVTICWSLKKGR